jgi:hypothetical protein
MKPLREEGATYNMTKKHSFMSKSKPELGEGATLCRKNSPYRFGE